jgi:hypothetical protein
VSWLGRYLEAWRGFDSKPAVSLLEGPFTSVPRMEGGVNLGLLQVLKIKWYEERRLPRQLIQHLIAKILCRP